MDLLAFIRTADPTKSELDASVDRLFDEEGSGNEEEPHDSVDGDQSADTLVISEAAEVVGEYVIPMRPRQKKRKTNIDAGEPSHPAKKLRDDYGAPGGPSVAGKSRPAVQRLLVGAALMSNDSIFFISLIDRKINYEII
ncbi:hypothetical protein Tco_0035679, partial [Tanacetum coccineum]